jgi:hypothetical protein
MKILLKEGIIMNKIKMPVICIMSIVLLIIGIFMTGTSLVNYICVEQD